MHLVAIGGSDAGISAALRARELDPSVEVTVVVAPAVTQVDSADERDVLFGPAGVAQHDELLMVRAVWSHSHVA